MIYLLLGFFIGLIVLGVVLGTRFDNRLRRRKEKFEAEGKTLTKKEEDSCSDGATACIFMGCAFSLVVGLICMCFILSNGSGLRKLEAFYTVNALNYETAVDRTASYLSEERFVVEALIPVEGSIEKLELTGFISSRITEWRDAVIRYNNTIASMQYWDDNIFTGVLVPDRVQGMKLLVIK